MMYRVINEQTAKRVTEECLPVLIFQAFSTTLEFSNPVFDAPLALHFTKGVGV